eukprot:GEMP01009410.1.p1 GENE.GEMP01009410.1~~GEMP01009410.1.p1  ORF type:complete len:764 (+),score=169.91 GEMP01009410.1:195-2486(+)
MNGTADKQKDIAKIKRTDEAKIGEEKNATEKSGADDAEAGGQENAEDNSSYAARKTQEKSAETLISSEELSAMSQSKSAIKSERAANRLTPAFSLASSTPSLPRLVVPGITARSSSTEQSQKAICVTYVSSAKHNNVSNDEHRSSGSASSSSISEYTDESSTSSDDSLPDMKCFRPTQKPKLPENYEKNKDWLDDLRQLDFANFKNEAYRDLGPPWACVVTFQSGDSITAPIGATIHRVRVLAGGYLGTFHPFVTLIDDNGEALEGETRCGMRHLPGLGFIKYELAPAPRSVTAINNESNSRLSALSTSVDNPRINVHGESKTASECFVARKRRMFHPQAIFAHPPNNCVVPRAQMAVMVDDVFRHPRGGRDLARIVRHSQFRHHAMPRTYHCIVRLITASFPGNASSTRVISALLDANIDPCYVPNPRKDPPLFFLAIQFNNILLVKRCMHAGADLASVSRLYRCTPLALACLHNRMEVARLLLQKNPLLVSYALWSSVDLPLCHAIRKGNAAMVDLLLEHRVDVNLSLRHKMSALLLATQKDDLPLVRRLVNAKADMDVRDVDGNFVLMLARTLPMITYFIEEGRKPSQLRYTNVRGHTAFLFHVSKGQRECAHALLYAKANAHATLPSGETALMMTVCSRRQENAIAILRSSYNFDVNTVDSVHQWSVLMRAVRSGNATLVQLLLERHANMDHVSKKGMTALKAAVRWKHDDIVKILTAHREASMGFQALLLNNNNLLCAVLVVAIAALVVCLCCSFFNY